MKPINKTHLPNLIVIGAPRCSTTNLHYLLNQHPDIHMSKIKEPHYFSSIDFSSPQSEILNITKDREKYLSYFEKGKKCKVRGESSSYYITDSKAAENISQTIPDVKLIAVLRDPIQRAFSHYLIYGRHGRQKETFTEYINSCLRGEKALVHDLVELGRYAKHLRRYLNYFNKEQIMVVMFSDLISNRQSAMRQIFDFLEVDPKKITKFKEAPKNPYMTPSNSLFSLILSQKWLVGLGMKLIPRSLIKKIRYGLLLKEGNKPTIEKKAEQLLIREYSPEVRKLEKLYNKKFTSLYYDWSKRPTD